MRSESVPTSSKTRTTARRLDVAMGWQDLAENWKVGQSSLTTPIVLCDRPIFGVIVTVLLLTVTVVQLAVTGFSNIWNLLSR